MEKFITLKQAYLRPIQQSHVLQFIISFSKSKCEKHPFQYMKRCHRQHIFVCQQTETKSLQNDKDGQPCTKTYSKNLKPKGLTYLSYKWKEVGRRRTEQHIYNLRTVTLLQVTLCVCAEFRNWEITQEFMKLSSNRTRQLIRT